MKTAEELWQAVRQASPMVHAVSNVVTANDCANLLLAVGARPIMAQVPAEAAEITAACRATVLNLGTPNDEKFAACRAAGQEANRLGHPVVLDPVGVGASAYRRRETQALLGAVHPQIVRANAGEVRALLQTDTQNWGVDSPLHIQEQERTLARELARRLGCVVLLTGEVDLVTDGERSETISGGTSHARQITGMGCMLSVLCGALAVVEEPFEAAVAAAKSWKACAERAEARSNGAGLGCLHAALFDEASLLGQAAW